ncbi:MAG TPA: family 1 glycosylhydrolase [Thermoanaerobaculia bacterium]|nr:family 1 glycosylhydrolase [Thermoanaerobaculia bacterium]
MSAFPFPDRPRLFGVAVSHYQVEGGDPCDWTDWEAAGRTRGGACGRAADSWRRYEEDAALAAGLGANAFRFSVSWSRVEPRRGVFDASALARYRRFVERLVSLGLEPVVTLHHYTHPKWFHVETPWTSPASVDAFARFARETARALFPLVRLFLTFNEPLVLLLGGFLDGQIPPGLADSRAAARALDHILAAHAEAAGVLRQEAPGAAIGVAHNMMDFAADRPGNPLDALLARHARRLYNTAFLEAFATGRWNLWIPPFTRLTGRRDALPGSLDLVGVNYYSRLHVRFPAATRVLTGFAYRDRQGRGLADNGWEIAPASFAALLGDAGRLGLPVLVTENGLADGADALRPAFLKSHFAALAAAEAAGVPVAGYLYWSLLDNFEWLDGYGPKFGLYAVDPGTFERRPRPSAAIFRDLGKSFLALPLRETHAQKSVQI